MSRRPKKKVLVKILIIGESGVGKTAILHQYVMSQFIQEHKATIGADFLTKEMNVDDKVVTLQIWDTAGQERFQSLGNAFYRGADACIMVYDITDDNTFREIDSWRNKFINQANIDSPRSYPFLLIGNKTDLESQRKISHNQGEGYARDNGMEFAETSALRGTNIEKAFINIAEIAAESDTVPFFTQDLVERINIENDGGARGSRYDREPQPGCACQLFLNSLKLVVMSSHSKWFYTHNGKDKPRVSISELIQLFNTGKIDCKTYVWHKKYCKEWTAIHQVGYIQDAMIRIQPSIIRARASHDHSSNATSEIQEIVANDFGPLSESDEVNINNINNMNNINNIGIAPHIIDSKHSSTSIDYECINNKVNKVNKVNKQKKRRKSSESKYGINQLVEINDPSKLGICYGLIVDIKNKKMMIKYNNKQFGKEWFDLNDFRISVVTDSRKKQEIQSRVVLPSTNIYHKNKRNKKNKTSPTSSCKSCKSSLSSTININNINEERLSLLSQRKLLNIERDELHREQDAFYYLQKQHETEVWAVKNDYIEQTKKLKKQYNIYKKMSDDPLNNDKSTDIDIIDIDKKHKTAQILYRRSTELLQKVQDATVKMEVYRKICDEKCNIERELIEKQEIDRNKYLLKINKLRDEMINAPWLILSDSNKSNKSDNNIDCISLHKQLLKTYESIREQRRKFLPVQRKWAKLIAKHQVYHHDEKVFLNIRQKLQNMRKYEKEYKLAVFDEIKSMLNNNCNDNEFNEFKLCLKKKQILLDYKTELIQDRERQIRNEKKLLRLQQRNLDESIMELQYERELIFAEKTKITKLKDTESLESLKHELQDTLHKNDKLQIKLTHFEESMKKENNNKEKHEQNYEKFTKMMENLTKQFEQMVGTKDREMEEWKTKATELKIKYDKLFEENQELIAKNEQLEYNTLPQLNIENEHLREQIQEMIISSDEASKRLNDLNDLNQIQCHDTLSSIRSKLANSDENGRLITKHESQHSMTAIVDLVKKTKQSQSQSIDLAILDDVDVDDDDDDDDNDDESIDDSFSDHLGLIEDMLLNHDQKNKNKNKNKNNKKNKIHLMHSDTDTVNDSGSGDTGDTADEPPMFWNHNDLQNDQHILQEMISNPNGVLDDVLDDVMTPPLIDHSSLSDWDKSDDTKSVKKTKKRTKSIKKKRKKSSQSIDGLKNIKRNKKRSSKKLNKNELLIINVNENKHNQQNNDYDTNDI